MYSVVQAINFLDSIEGERMEGTERVRVPKSLQEHSYLSSVAQTLVSVEKCCELVLDEERP